ncbi:hypothetical protein BCR32DRAFT_136893 [Anaeromyces robustus]|uniref:Kazal-like domain-containing protein n=1 Tax=Anaeromyces robustus TaxID=1754192 RepID=A0A1Y1XPJ8_9FUNG|nr:hypothetical protein BCR32DRAFT_136893 [Anaeromyces robustus]|eukprot:ORX87679.1 hypothetical protein BCR32DRAFT_136893 [Anaeromyces robustus]
MFRSVFLYIALLVTVFSGSIAAPACIDAKDSVAPNKCITIPSGAITYAMNVDCPNDCDTIQANLFKYKVCNYNRRTVTVKYKSCIP